MDLAEQTRKTSSMPYPFESMRATGVCDEHADASVRAIMVAPCSPTNESQPGRSVHIVIYDYALRACLFR